MKLLFGLILLFVNYCYLINANKLFVNFVGTYNTDSCSESPIGTGFSMALGQCVQMQGIFSYVTNSPEATIWMATLGGDGNSFTLKQFHGSDKLCTEDPINTVKYNKFDTCVQQPSFLTSNNSLLANNNNNNYNNNNLVYSKLTLSQNAPSYAPNSIIIARYNSSDSVCNFNNQKYGISYSAGSVIYNENGVSVYVVCDQSNQSILFHCQNDQCVQSFTDTACDMSPNDLQIYCN
ncbi:hypothetical protein ACTFIR_006478 [Dictyostelium discoideum]